jgi:phage shock protein C
MLAGVAGGLAETWDVDPSVVRLVWALLVIFTGGIALLVYIIMAIVVPDEDVVYPPTAAQPVPAAPPVATDPDGAASDTGAATAAAAATVPPGAAAPAPGTLWGPAPSTAAEARAARRQARAERRATGGVGGFPAAVILGLILVAVGGFFLLEQWIPSFDWDWFWPLLLVGIGVVLLIGALTRRDKPGGTP